MESAAGFKKEKAGASVVISREYTKTASERKSENYYTSSHAERARVRGRFGSYFGFSSFTVYRFVRVYVYI